MNMKLPTTKTPRHQIAFHNRRPSPAVIAVNFLLLHSTLSSACSSSTSIRPKRTFLLPDNQNRHRRRSTNTFLGHSPLDSHLPRKNYNDELLERFRGGGVVGGKTQHATRDTKSPSKISGQEAVSTNDSQNWTFKVGATAATIIAIILSITHWDTLKSLFDKEKFRKAIIHRLNDVASKGDKGLLLYTFGFVFWELCGLPTAVVETAAGMAFGFGRGLLGSFVGKTCGSLLAFALGRTLLSDIAGKKMEGSKSFKLIERVVAQNPMRSALIVRYSPFPQLVKNFAMSMTRPVTYPMFAIAIVVHGFPFSLLWAALGKDSSLRLRASEAGETMPANFVLNGLLVFVTVFGFVVSPAITGWWLADLGKEAC